MFHKLHVLGMKDDLWDKVRGLGTIFQAEQSSDSLATGTKANFFHIFTAINN